MYKGDSMQELQRMVDDLAEDALRDEYSTHEDALMWAHKYLDPLAKLMAVCEFSGRQRPRVPTKLEEEIKICKAVIEAGFRAQDGMGVWN